MWARLKAGTPSPESGFPLPSQPSLEGPGLPDAGGEILSDRGQLGAEQTGAAAQHKAGEPQEEGSGKSHKYRTVSSKHTFLPGKKPH